MDIRDLTDAEKILVLVSKLIEYDQALQESQTSEEEKKAREIVKFSLDVVSRTRGLRHLTPVIRKLQIKIKSLEEGKIKKEQFSCQELIDRIILETVEKMSISIE